MFPVDAQAGDLRIEIRKVSALQERVITEAYSRNNVARAECGLLDLREKFVNGTIKDEFPDCLKGNEVLRPDLGSVENIKIKLVLVLLFNNLDCETPFRRTSIVDSLD